MRKLSLLPIFALLALLAFAAPSPALTPPEDFFDPASEEAAEFDTDGELELEADEDEIDSDEACELGGGEACDESEESDECILEGATAKVAPRPGSNTVRLIIHYQAFAPAAVAIDARLRAGRGHVHLGTDHAHFRRAGVFRDSFLLGEKEMDRALGAREFEVELRPSNTPRYCRLELNGAPRRAKRSLRSNGSGRSGDRGRTRGRSHRGHRR